MRCFAVLLLIAGVLMAGCQAPCTSKQNLPPPSMLMHPGPGVNGPGPGVAMYQGGGPSSGMTSQIHFGGPEGMTINWDVSAPGAFDSQAMVCPANYNFPQGAIYRLKLSNIPGRPGVELYPTLEVGPTMPRTEAYLAHNSVPVVFTPEDFDQVTSGNFVTKVLYLPDPAFQELALAGVETLVSTRLEPGVDPIVEADRRGRNPGHRAAGQQGLAGPRRPQPGRHGHAGLVRGVRPRPGLAVRLHLGCQRAAIRDGDVRHADRSAGSAQHPAGSPRRTVPPRDHQPYARMSAGADARGVHRREAGAGHDVS